jgi:GT2 family glycosyltransferase
VRPIPPSTPLECTVVVVTYDNARVVDDALSCLAAQADQVRMRVIVADNASRDDTVAAVRGLHPHVEVVQTGGNLGYAGALNRAAHVVDRRTAAVVVMNADVRLAPGSLARLLTTLAADPAVAVVAPRLVDDDGRLQRSLRREPTVLRTWGDALLGAHLPHRPGWAGEVVLDPAAYAVAGDVDWATGAVLAVRGDVWRANGPWDERFFLYSEETDYARRLREAGWRVRYEPAALAVHEGGASGSGPALDGLLAVNRVRYARKHHGPASAVGVRAALLVGSALRCRRATSRARWRVLTRRSRWSTLPHAVTT